MNTWEELLKAKAIEEAQKPVQVAEEPSPVDKEKAKAWIRMIRPNAVSAGVRG